MRKNLSILLLLFLNASVFAQFFSISEKAEISILTIGPGDNLYDKFGHSAFRVHDQEQEIDIVYNYGVYDFDTPNFYGKFAQGKLNYKLVVWPYEPFYQDYVQQDRWIKEQILNLTYSEKQALIGFLQNNARPENQYYLYDFFYDNCATKMRDVLVSVLGDRLIYHDDFVSEKLTFRELIQKNVRSNTWGSLGMDVAIGAVVDVKASAWQYQFLPEYVSTAAASAEVRRDTTKLALIRESQTLYRSTGTRKEGKFYTSPLFIFGLISILIGYITLRDKLKNKRSRWLDVSLFTVTGLIGILLFLLWFATDHSSTANNYNLLWAFPISLFFVFGLAKTKPNPRIVKYIFLLLLMLVLLVIHWLTGVQIFAIGLVPLLIALALRYCYLIYYFKKNN